MPAADNTDEDFAVVDDRDKVLLHGGFYKLFHRTANVDRLVVPAFGQRADADIFGAFEIQGSMAFDVAKQITFGEGANVHTLVVQYGQGGVAVVFHLFQCLAQGAVFGYEGNVLFGR